MKRYLYSSYFVNYEKNGRRHSVVLKYKQAILTSSVLYEINEDLSDVGEQAFIVNISKVS